MQIEQIKEMSREHLEDLVEYIIRQDETHINVAPDYPDWIDAKRWVEGFDYSRQRLIEMIEDHELLKNHLP